MKPLRRIRHSLSVKRSPQAKALLLTEVVVGVASAVSSLEALWAATRQEADEDILRWRLAREMVSSGSRTLLKALDATSGAVAERTVEGARLAAAVSLLAPWTSTRTRAAALTWLAASSALTYRRRSFQSDGSDQLLFQVQTATALARLSGDRRITDTCLWYISLQSVLAYSVAGYSKVAGSQWRSGAALSGILRTEMYGSKWAFDLVQEHPRVARMANIAVIAGECCFPLLYFIKKGTLARHFALTAGSFHLVNTCTMGLGRFFWAFTSSYPALIYTARQVTENRSMTPNEII